MKYCERKYVSDVKSMSSFENKKVFFGILTFFYSCHTTKRSLPASAILESLSVFTYLCGSQRNKNKNEVCF